MAFTNERNPAGRQLRDDMRALAGTDRLPKPLPEIPEQGPQPKLRGVAEQLASASGGGGDGIASPLVEQDIAQREYHAAGTYSSDGLFFIPAVKTVVMTDDNGREVRFEYAEPEAP